LAKVLLKIRRFLTWPFRKMLQIGQHKISAGFINQELVLLNQIAEHLLFQLADQLRDKQATDVEQQRWWNGLYRLLRQRHSELLQNFNQAAVQYQQDFQPEIEATAQRLYKKLAQQPVVLNSLRATRVSADALLIAVSIQMGGIGLHDLFITPAMLSITSLLTESAIGGYMKKLEAQLKQQQRLTIEKSLFINVLQQALLELPQLITDTPQFAISPEQLQYAQQQRMEKRHGLRLF
jgi:hypothetical protein